MRLATAPLKATPMSRRSLSRSGAPAAPRTVEAELTRPCDVVVADTPEGLARLAWRRRLAVRAVEGVVAHRVSIALEPGQGGHRRRFRADFRPAERPVTGIIRRAANA